MGTREGTRRPYINTSYGSDALVRPDETRKAERACVNTAPDQNYWTSVSRSYKTRVFLTRVSLRALKTKVLKGYTCEQPSSLSLCRCVVVSRHLSGMFFENRAEWRNVCVSGPEADAC